MNVVPEPRGAPTNESRTRPRADPGPASGRVSPDPGASTLGRSVRGQRAVHERVSVRMPTGISQNSPPFPPARQIAMPPSSSTRAKTKASEKKPTESGTFQEDVMVKNANRWSQSESAPPRAVSVDPGPVAVSVSPDPGRDPGPAPAP